MTIDPRNLRVAEAVRLLNSTPLGEVVQPHVVYRHLNRAGYRIGDGRTIDLLQLRGVAVPPRARDVRARVDRGGLREAQGRGQRARPPGTVETSRDIAADGWVHEPKDAERKAKHAAVASASSARRTSRRRSTSPGRPTT